MIANKSNKVIYGVATGVFTLIVLMFAGNSIFNHAVFSERFASLGHPTYIIYPLTIAKISGLIAIWSNKSIALKEWAYAGFFFVFVLAMLAEIHAENGEIFSSSIALTTLLASYIFWKKNIAQGVKARVP